MEIETDKETRLWMDERPGVATTLVRCDSCGLFYKYSLGHDCEKRKEMSKRSARNCNRVVDL